MASVSCATSSYKVVDQYRNRVVLQVSPDRVVLECEEQKDHDEASDPKGRYGFLIHVLDEESTVLGLSRMSAMWRKDCFEHMEKVNRILREGSRVTLVGMGDLDEPRRVEEDFKETFPGKGTYAWNGRSLKFLAAWNEHNRCFNTYRRPTDACAWTEFPFKRLDPTPLLSP